MYLVIDLERNMLIWAYRDRFEAYRAANKLEANGQAIVVRFDASFLQ